MPFDQANLHGLSANFGAMHHQVAAIPLHWTNGRPEVLLITTRGQRHWTVPKGWPLSASPAPDCAAREAYEEAGVRGRVERYSLGEYQYWKKGKRGRLIVRVTAFALHVDEVLRAWPERGERKRVWFSPDAAAGLVGNEDLAALIKSAANARFAPSLDRSSVLELN